MTCLKRALVSFSHPPEFDRDSGSRRLWDLIELLLAQGWTVTFLASNHAGNPRYVRALQQRGVAVFDGAKVRTEDLLLAGKFSLAVFSLWTVAEVYLPILRRISPQTRIVVDSVDLGFLRNARRCFQSNPVAGPAGSVDDRYGTELVRELNIYAAADAVLTVSAKEAEWVNDLTGQSGLAHVVADIEDSPISTVPLSERRGILFMGCFRHLPNVDAVEFLCKSIVPHLDPALTALHPIYILGEGIDEKVRRLADRWPQVRMVGWVPSVRTYLERVRLSVVPLRFGAGTKRKLLQSLVAGTPAVSTSVGAEGFAVEPGRHLLVADEPQAFAQAVTRLLQDPALWQSLSRSGRKQVLKAHRRQAVSEQLRNVIATVFARKGKGAEAEPDRKKPARLDMQQYHQLRTEIQHQVRELLPRDARLIVVSRGDDEMLKLDGRAAWHFPQTADGVYAGHYPADAAGAIQQLETLRLAKGATYVLFPQTALWWLDHYKGLRQHLEANAVEVLRLENLCTIFCLAQRQRPLLADTAGAAGVACGTSEAPKAPAAAKPTVRLIAFYLPQFHPIPENDEWWGEGFTEWTNVGRAKPLFPDHYQPHIPGDLGFYDLRLAETRKAQAALARQYGIFGFCYYHYWFKGKRLLDRPFNEVMLSREPDLPFCLCWANEPWSRSWNGRPEAMLQPQEYSPEDDLLHIRWLLPALADSRAIHIDGKPAFLVYQGCDLPDPARTVETWRREVARAGLPGVYLMSVETGRDAGWDATQVGFDAKLLFQPQFTVLAQSGADIPVAGKESLRVYDYQKACKALATPPPVAYPRYETVCPAWDNSPRRGEAGVVLHNSTPAAYEQWLRQAVERAARQPRDCQVVFVNAWNEWGEGCHLEPDLRSGHAYLEATHRAWLSGGSRQAVPSGSVAATAPPVQGAALPSSPPVSATPEPAALSAAATLYQALLATARGDRGAEYVPLSEQCCPAAMLPLKAIAFYLPQFHAIPENDAWWGRGFTEWTNVSKAVPQFAGHYQPHLPGELGFYDLRVPEVQRRQVELARQYGLHGFCFYYYWFAGKRLLERPLEQFAADAEIDFPFCVCWANENWSRRWDGREEDVLIAQNHSEESDLNFIRDLEPLLRHRNYIRVNGRPLVMVYRVRLLPNPAETARRWREYCRQSGLGSIYLVAAQVFENLDPREVGFDAAVEFPPNTPGPRTDLSRQVQLLNPGFSGCIYDYADLIRLTLDRERPPYPLFKTVCPSWDNDPRKPGRGATYANSSPNEYCRWLDGACRQTLEEPDADKRLVFINAWNEWGEGTHLEPDRRYGYAYLQTTAEVLASLPKRIANPNQDWTLFVVSHDAHVGGAQLVLLNQLQWLKQHTSIQMRVLCLDSGPWLPRFKSLAPTVVLNELPTAHAEPTQERLVQALQEFCGSTPDLIYANSVASGRVLGLLRLLGTPILTHFHELESSIRRYAGGWIGDVTQYSTHYIACCQPVQENLIARHGVSADAITTIPASISPDPTFRPLDVQERKFLRQKLGLPSQGRLVFGCGVGMPFRKGADLFIELGIRLAKQGYRDCWFFWIGEFPAEEADPELGAWSDHLAKLQGQKPCRISFLGPKPNPKDYLQVADVFLLPSREDPFPLVALEAAECGVPIVCFDGAGGMPAFVADGCGAVVPFGDLAAMEAQLTRLLEAEELRRQLGAQAREKLLSRFTVNATAPQVFSVCRRVAQKQPTVSVIMPGYNHARYLRERLESIFHQTYRDFEVILLDDASTDNSLEILEEYRDHPDVRIVPSQKNSGSTFKQWLKGIDMARADLIWIAESDDRCEAQFLEKLLPAFQNPKVRVAYANSQVIDERGLVVGEYTNCDYLTSLSPTKWAKDYCTTANEEVNDGFGVKNTILSASSAVFRRFHLSAKDRKTLEQMRLAGDWYFFTHAMAGGEVFYTAAKLNHHRRHSESVIGKLLRQNRVGDFFSEFYRVQSLIFTSFHLLSDFQAKWEKYLRDQWKAFYPDRPFEELKGFYPLDEARQRIAASGLGHSPLIQRSPVKKRKLCQRFSI